MTSWAEGRRLAALERDHERQQALTVACPAPPQGCEAAVGEECRNLRTGMPLEHQVAHDRRCILASQAMQGDGGGGVQ